MPRKRCLTNEAEKPKPEPIRLLGIAGAFLVLGVGIGLSLIAFIVEKIVAVRRARRAVTVIVAEVLPPAGDW